MYKENNRCLPKNVGRHERMPDSSPDFSVKGRTWNGFLRLT